ncbi:[Pyruvate dehydrogenase [acetyl-transferring]]-phosphatase [Drechslerella dactyloides]|uniref:[Pyruvate dehydrogenase [acetyl-transferring]]-phosphatase n=1 Tax=Drechslerella dactyloides TaxID=74499 RepID=A0AAD6NHV9_DREDA|nr:[Pyruvate dehydrogenase [acetyl-transferring]]-phosphatase [Drechslerella dactyloides]
MASSSSTRGRGKRKQRQETPEREERVSPPPSKRQVVASSTTIAGFFTPASQKAPGLNFLRHGSLLYGSWKPVTVASSKTTVSISTAAGSLVTSSSSTTAVELPDLKPIKIAAFDLDSNLISTKSGKKFGKEADDWKWWHATVPHRLRKAADDGYRLVVFTNQNGLKLDSPKHEKQVKDWKQKLNFIVSALNLPISIYAATSTDGYRKPRTGMFEYCLSELGDGDEASIDLENSVFVGDAAGRKGDFSGSDRKFAQNIGLPFLTPEEYFLDEKPEPYEFDIDPSSFGRSSIPPDFAKKYPVELVLLTGRPGSGKSTFSVKYLEPLGYQRINQDILKTREKCLKAAEGYLKEGKSVVVDSTNPSQDTRAVWRKLAEKVGDVALRCVYLTTPEKLCHHNDGARAFSSVASLNPEKRESVPSMAFLNYKSKFQEPQLSEGFEDITVVDFEFRGTDAENTFTLASKQPSPSSPFRSWFSSLFESWPADSDRSRLVYAALASVAVVFVAALMQRAAVRAAVASARAPSFLLRNRRPPNVGAARALATNSFANGAAGSTSYIRKFTLAIVSSLVLGSAYIAYKGSNPFLARVSLLSNSDDQTAFSTNAKEDVRIRKIVAVDHESLYTGTLPADGRLTKDTLDGRGGRKVLEMLTPEEATAKLRQSEESYLVGRERGVYRYDVVQLPSNDPIEDDHAERIIEVPSSVTAADDVKGSTDWMFWGVFDGHSGWYTSAKLRQLLIGFVARELNATYKASSASPKGRIPTPEAIDTAIKQGFIRLDNEIIHESVEKVLKGSSKPAAAELLAPAFSGSCALLAFYDSQTNLLRVACTGDSRAVLGRRQSDGKWAATALSVDQTGSNKDEAQRIRDEHPGEEFAVSNGRVLGGLEPTRAFGDSLYKWSVETQNIIKSKYLGRTPSPRLKTPPYVTAEPVVTTTKIQPEKGDFVVMATDGLWEMLSNEEVVGLVAKWLEGQNKAKNPSAASRISSFFGFGGDSQKNLPLATNHDGNQDDDGQRVPIRQKQYGIKAQDDRFIITDQNCATHLVRNALGGKDSDMVCALLTLQSPYSRRYRDDLTVEVIFFGEGDKSGNVVVNEVASSKSKTQ